MPTWSPSRLGNNHDPRAPPLPGGPALARARGGAHAGCCLTCAVCRRRRQAPPCPLCTFGTPPSAAERGCHLRLWQGQRGPCSLASRTDDAENTFSYGSEGPSAQTALRHPGVDLEKPGLRSSGSAQPLSRAGGLACPVGSRWPVAVAYCMDWSARQLPIEAGATWQEGSRLR